MGLYFISRFGNIFVFPLFFFLLGINRNKIEKMQFSLIFPNIAFVYIANPHIFTQLIINKVCYLKRYHISSIFMDGAGKNNCP